MLHPDIRVKLWPYMGGIARRAQMKAIAVGGVEDHVHILLSLPATMPLSKAMQHIKGGSSKWIHESFQNAWGFAWQKEYAAISVSPGNINRVVQYIKNQELHHKTVSFKDEYVSILKSEGIAFDERYLWN